MPRAATPPIVRVVEALLAHYGEIHDATPTAPFAMLVYECACYLVDDDRRAKVFAALDREVGVDPESLTLATDRVLLRVLEPGGMLVAHRLEKVRKAAALAREIGLDTLARAIVEAPKRARTLLKKFPNIGDPGADKILLFNGAAKTLALDSNGLRVVCRLGLVDEDRDYGKTYRAAQRALDDPLPDDRAWLVRAHRLLRHHGRELCKRSAPECGACPLRDGCKHAAETAGS
ncbi:MAG: hypothetical protein ACHREM_09595 [Polyangiales bacterium]